MTTVDITVEYRKLTLSEMDKFITDNNNRQKFVSTRLKNVPSVAARMVLQLENFKISYIKTKDTLDKVLITEENCEKLYQELKRIRYNLKVHRRLLELD